MQTKWHFNQFFPKTAETWKNGERLAQMVSSNVIWGSGLGLNTIITYISDEKWNFPEANGLPMYRYQNDRAKGLRLFCLYKRGFGGVRWRKAGVGWGGGIPLNVCCQSSCNIEIRLFYMDPIGGKKTKSVGGSQRDSVH